MDVDKGDGGRRETGEKKLGLGDPEDRVAV